jgi:hypothetical protein
MTVLVPDLVRVSSGRRKEAKRGPDVYLGNCHDGRSLSITCYRLLMSGVPR